jgi:hypothetical protein
MFFKCSFCPKAFVDKSDIYDHKQAAHADDSSLNGRQKVADFSLLYKAPFLKSPNNLFSTREGFEKRMSTILTKWPKKFLYRCYACSSYFETIDKLTDHNSLWCQMQYRTVELQQQNLSKLFSEPEVSTSLSDKNMSERDRREEMIQHLAHLEALSAHCPDCTKVTLDFRAHLTSHSNATSSGHHKTTQHIIQSENPETITPTDSTPVRVTRQRLETIGRQVAGLSESRPSSVTEVCPTKNVEKEKEKEIEIVKENTKFVQPVQQVDKSPKRIDTPIVISPTTEPADIFQTRKQQVDKRPKRIQNDPIVTTPTVELTDISQSRKQQIEKRPKRVDSPIVSSPTVEPTDIPQTRKRGRPSSICPTPLPRQKSVKHKVVDAKPFVETLGIDVPSNRRLLAFNRLDRQALAFGSTVKQKVQHRKDQQFQFSCALCPFDSDVRDEFQAHIQIHKPVVVNGVLSEKTGQASGETGQEAPAECLQCKECGMCFASEPSWKKHLFLLHRIKNPAPEDYCADLKTQTPLTVR